MSFLRNAHRISCTYPNLPFPVHQEPTKWRVENPCTIFFLGNISSFGSFGIALIECLVVLRPPLLLPLCIIFPPKPWQAFVLQEHMAYICGLLNITSLPAFPPSASTLLPTRTHIFSFATSHMHCVLSRPCEFGNSKHHDTVVEEGEGDVEEKNKRAFCALSPFLPVSRRTEDRSMSGT